MKPCYLPSCDVSCGYLFRYRNSTNFTKKACCALQDARKQLNNALRTFSSIFSNTGGRLNTFFSTQATFLKYFVTIPDFYRS